MNPGPNNESDSLDNQPPSSNTPCMEDTNGFPRDQGNTNNNAKIWERLDQLVAEIDKLQAEINGNLRTASPPSQGAGFGEVDK